MPPLCPESVPVHLPEPISPWSADCADALDWLRSKPTDWADVCVTSPPYTRCRTYGIQAHRHPAEWVAWLRPIVVEMCRVCRLVALNVSDQVRGHRYGGADLFLIADLLRLDGLQLGPAPYAVTRNGVPGSGQNHYHRRNWEPVYVLARPENLPPVWSDNTAFGHVPKYGPGGEKAGKVSAGIRLNQWGGRNDCDRVRRRNGHRPRAGRPSHTHNRDQLVTAIANPGNIIAVRNGGRGGEREFTRENEAPMNLDVAERFVCWYCPPGGLVVDPFLGSGTTCHAAIRHGRRFAGCDVRQSMVDLTGRRMVAVLGDPARA